MPARPLNAPYMYGDEFPRHIPWWDGEQWTCDRCEWTYKPKTATYVNGDIKMAKEAEDHPDHPARKHYETRRTAT